MDTAELRTEYQLGKDLIQRFEDDGFVRLDRFLSANILDALGDRLNRLVPPQNTAHQDVYSRAFRYLMHAWICDEFVRSVALSSRIAQVAADLLGVTAVRLSHDQAIFKDPGAGATPVHADQYHWPLSSDKTLSVWIPLQSVNATMGPLCFFAGSHCIADDKRIALEESGVENLEAFLRDSFEEICTEYKLGDVSFHYGWTFHRAGPNISNRSRKAFGVVYVEEGIRVIEPRGGVSIESLCHWSPGARVGEQLNSKRHPIAFCRH